ncbi:MAG: hypothetical protein IT259_06795 [Saprospiraceae bacterium]|nr:hypothetical protein [Saprospiraceae bacterium]
MLFLVIAPFVIPLVFLFAAGAFAAGRLYHRRETDRKRRMQLSAMAQRLGLQFREKDDFGLLQQLKSFDLFHRMRRWWHSGKITNVLSGKIGDTEVYLFDYIYYVSSNNSRRRIVQTVFFANDINWFLPNFKLKPETWYHKVLDRLGLSSDINFEEHPEFSERFHLNGELSDLVRDKFSGAVREFLTERPPSHLEGNNYYFLAYKPRKKLNPDEAEVFFENCRHLVELLKKEGKTELLNLAELRPVEIPEKLKNSD